MKDIKILLSELVKDSGEIISKPAVIGSLENQGPLINEPWHPLLDERLELLSRKRKENVIEIVGKLPAPPAISPEAIKSLYNDIGECIIFGLNGAAITLSAILVEFMLKFAAYRVEMGEVDGYDAGKWHEFEKLNFSKAISRARRNQLLTKKHRNLLHEFRERYQNPYNRHNIKNITALAGAEGRTRVNLETLEVEQIGMEGKDDHVIQAHAKSLVDAQEVMSVFEFVDNVVKLLFAKLGYPLAEQ
jgi:hypothetical protein